MRFLLGCVVLSVAAQGHDITTQVTWSREVSRLMARHCDSCHRDGGSAFPLSTFKEAQPHAKAIGKSVLERRMPPFGAVKGFGDLRDDQSLTQEQIELVSSWVQAGAPEGDPALAAKSAPVADTKPEPKAGAAWVADGKKSTDRPMTFVGIRPDKLPVESLRVVALRPDGTILPLIWFYRYDPKFALTYYFRQPLALPAGTKILTSAPDATVSLFAR
jgi:hypothetical protein